MELKSEFLFSYLDEYLGVSGFPDYPAALNGLQVEGAGEIRRLAVAVDASEEAIRRAVELGADLLLVHHGLFWGGAAPVTGRRFRKLAALIEGRLALYSAHLPLDAHPEVGNCAVLARELGVESEGRFGEYEGQALGWKGRAAPRPGNAGEGTEGGAGERSDPAAGSLEGGREDGGGLGRDILRERISDVVQGPVRLIPGGPPQVRLAGVVTGGGGSFIEAAAREGLDALITGEGAHHTYQDAMELGVNVYYAGHYATETWGVRALAAHLEREYGLPWGFIDLPTGL